MYINRDGRKILSNIHTSINYQTDITADMIVKKVINEKTGKEDLALNMEYWQNLKEPVSVVLDEAHALVDSRSAMSKLNKLVTLWTSLLRKVIGQNPSGEGQLVMITQLPNAIDTRIRQLANQVRYHVCHFKKECLDNNCGQLWSETSETAEPLWKCPRCNNLKVRKFNHVIEIWHFKNMPSFLDWKYMGMSTYHRHYLVNDIEDYFPLYSTLQIQDLFNDL